MFKVIVPVEFSLFCKTMVPMSAGFKVPLGSKRKVVVFVAAVKIMSFDMLAKFFCPI
jgi:hypothetical protein